MFPSLFGRFATWSLYLTVSLEIILISLYLSLDSLPLYSIFILFYVLGIVAILTTCACCLAAAGSLDSDDDDSSTSTGLAIVVGRINNVLCFCLNKKHSPV